MLDDWAVSEALPPCVPSFNASESGQCGMVGWWIGIWDSIYSLHLPGEAAAAAAEEAKKWSQSQRERERGGGEERVNCSSVSLNLNTSASSFLASSQCPFHFQTRRDRPFPTLRCHYNIAVANLSLQYLNRQRKLAVATCSATRPLELPPFFIASSPSSGGSIIGALFGSIDSSAWCLSAA